MKRLLERFLSPLRQTWWLKVLTDSPRCEYYFGPFMSEREADQAKGGHMEDLTLEGSELLRVSVLRCLPPSELTIEYPETA